MTGRQPRILYMVPAWPHEKSFGKQVRLLNVGRALQKLGEVKLVVAYESVEAETVEKTSNEFQVYCGVQTLVRPPSGLRGRINWWLDPRSLNLYSSVADAHDRARVCDGLTNFDLIWINGLRVANMFGLWAWPR